jgi:hypothetical protein
MSSISDSRKPDEAQLLPAYEVLPREERGLSPDARRLFWSLNGPLTTSLWIMETRKMPESRKPYFRQTTGGDATTSLHPAKLVAKPDASSGRNFVTIHDYVSAVHPWLIERREDILGTKGLVENDKEPLPSETKLMVDSFDP